MKNDNSKKRFLVGLHAFYMLFLAPIFLFVAVIMGMNNFSDTYRYIENGFGGQIEAISLVTGSFLDANQIEHEIMRKYQPAGWVFDPSRSALIGVDQRSGGLIEVDPLFGGATVLNRDAPSGLIGLALDPSAKVYYAVDSSGAVYQTQSRNLSGLEPIASIEEDATGIAFSSADLHLYVSGKGLYQIDPASKTVAVVREDLGVDIAGMTFDSARGQLIALVVDPVALCEVDVSNGSITNSVALYEGPLHSAANSLSEKELTPEETWDVLEYDRIIQSQNEKAKQAVKKNLKQFVQRIVDLQKEPVDEEAPQERNAFEAPVYGIAWNQDASTFMISSDALMAANLASGAIAQTGIWSGYRNELTDAYLAVVSPMRRIKEKLNITYLYTFTQFSSDDVTAITYNFDANFDADHSWIGDDDSLPPESVYDLYGRVLLGHIYQSDIVYWEEWGLIKTGYAPIRDDHGAVRAVVGTDVNVSIIGAKTRVQLLQTIALGLLAFLLAMIVMYAVTTAMIKPISVLNETALTVAAGDYGKKAPEMGAKEFHALSLAFNQLSLDMKDAQDKRSFDNKILHYQTTRSELVRKLIRIREALAPTQMEGWSALHCNSKPGEEPVSAMLRDPSGALAWAGFQKENSLVVLKTLIDITSISRKLMRSFRGDWTLLSSALNGYYEKTVQGFFYIQRKEQRFYSLCRAPFECFQINPASVRRFDLSEETSFPVQPGDALVMISKHAAQSVQPLLQNEPFGPGEDRANVISEKIKQVLDQHQMREAERVVVIVMDWAG